MNELKILVVDDESRMRKLVKDFLTRAGYQVLEAQKRLIPFILQRESIC